jgi:hypothetical protein
MLAEVSTATTDPVFLRHDLMVELGRLEMAMEDACSRRGTDEEGVLESLKVKHARIAAVLSRLNPSH